jgi:hypothetical protein
VDLEAFSNNRVRVTDIIDGIEIEIHAYARKPRAKSEAEIVITWNPYSKQINDAARAAILDFLESKPTSS